MSKGRIQGVKKASYNSIDFRSTLEAHVAKILDDLGIDYSYESRKLVLLEGFYSPYQKKKVVAITYTPDFIVGPILIECKGFETPEWRIKKKLVLKYLQCKEPDTVFCQIHDARKALIEALDPYWNLLGYKIKTESKPSKSQEVQVAMYDSIDEAMTALGLNNKFKGAILRSLTGKTDYIYNYKWSLVKKE